MKIYIIAGEASGDIYGGKLISALKSQSKTPIEFRGIGGQKMEGQGLKSLFAMSEISLMGFWEIVPHIRNLLARINQTVEDIKEFQPDMVITIDSPGFCCRVAKKLQDETFKLVHYVAPTVWAYKPGRAKKFANLFDHMLVILPFEPPYFDAVGLKTTYIGHPITETKMPDSGDSFRAKHNIEATDTLLCMMPGSRITEIKRLLPIFLKTTQLMTAANNLKIAMPIIPALKDEIERIVDKSPVSIIYIENDEDKFACLKTANLALVKSGTGTLEVSMAGCPMVIAYKVGFITHKIVKSLIKIKYANLINLILDEELIPEYIQEQCTPFLMAQNLDRLLTDEMARDSQIEGSKAILQHMGVGQVPNPSEKAAKTVLELLEK